ncbi:hypothetical protein EPA93_16260 [Ktedonosporobacter rubrisoli]|uniref:Uncharacterized protein n=1 Tax=Ktedonosporobacter rubrisoli TaxID=2509675 RepID=A0A4P6JQL0_KTERU|nr:hypothetical protein [Ktedonosporobacter rubrisoli]QBD77460.1 hypothetical protein EPA93_16260 [Ktedonosporobacter rubrisoli]
MTTSETDELNLIQVERIQGISNVKLASPAPEGFSPQVFRNCHHIGSVNQENGLRRLTLRSGDTILHQSWHSLRQAFPATRGAICFSVGHLTIRAQFKSKNSLN